MLRLFFPVAGLLDIPPTEAIKWPVKTWLHGIRGHNLFVLEKLYHHCVISLVSS